MSDEFSSVMDKALDSDETEACPEGLCDGSGIIAQGEFDELDEVSCLCRSHN